MKGKFRAKCLRNNQEWVYGSYVKYLGTIRDENQDFDIDINTVGEFTRLFDKNVNEIYEGDIVKFNNQIGKIVYEYGSFGIAIEDGINYENLQNYTKENLDNYFEGTFNDNFIPLFEIYYNLNNTDNVIDEIEIIGNIYDNFKF